MKPSSQLTGVAGEYFVAALASETCANNLRQ